MLFEPLWYTSWDWAAYRQLRAVLEFQRITSGLDTGRTIVELLPGVELPAEIATAWIS